MNKYLRKLGLISLFLIALILISGCNNLEAVEQDTNIRVLYVKIPLVDLDDNLAKAMVRVIKDEFSNQKIMPIKDEAINVAFFQLARGEWQIEVELKDKNGELVYQGKSKVVISNDLSMVVNDIKLTKEVVGSEDGVKLSWEGIVFSSFISHFLKDGSYEIFIMNTDGSGMKQLTTNGYNYSPILSPNGEQIAFCSYYQIYLMNSDGSGMKRLTTSGYNYNPAWSPSGEQIAFDSITDTGQQIFTINVDGSGLQQLTFNHNNFNPSWSSDGEKIIFTSDRDGDHEIYLLNLTNNQLKQLTFDSSDNLYPAWSPNGEKIAFTSNRDGDDEIYIMNPDGSRIEQLTVDNNNNRHPVWLSKDEIIFTSDRDGDSEIYLINLKSGQLKQLTENDYFDGLSIN